MYSAADYSATLIQTMKKIIRIIAFIAFCLSVNLQAQTYFIKTLEKSTSSDKLFGNKTLTNGDIILSGHSSSDILIIRTDSLGNNLWQKSFPATPDSEEGKDCAITGTGNIVVAGYSKPSTGNFGAILVNADLNGNLQWIKKYRNPSTHSKAWPVDTTFGNNLYLAGWTSDLPGNGNWTTGFVLKTNSLGDTLWTRRFGEITTGKHTYFRSLSSTNDGGCIAVGETNEYGTGGYDVVAVKLSSNGDTTWTKIYGSTGDDYGWNVKQLTDGNFIICGNTGSFGFTTNKGDMLILKVDTAGNIIWAKTIGDANSANTLDAARSVSETHDNQLIFCGYSGIPGVTPSSDEDGIIIKLNSSTGDTIWTKRYPLGIDNEHFRSINKTRDSSYIISGYSSSLGTNSDDIIFLKINEQGFAGGCVESAISPAFQVNNQTLETNSGVPYYSTGFTVTSMSNSDIAGLTGNTLCDSTLTKIIEPTGQQVSYYPNPIVDDLNLLISNELNPQDIYVTNLLGSERKKLFYKVTGGKVIIDFSNISAGVYFVTLNFKTSAPKSFKIIKH